MKQLLFIALFALGFQAQANNNDKINDGLLWGCALEDIQLTMVKDKQAIPVFGLLYASEYVGYGQVVCQSLLKNEEYRSNIEMTLKVKSIGLGTEKPKKLNLVSLGTGIKTNSPETLFGNYSVGAKLGFTLIEGEVALGLKFHNPKNGLAMDFALFAEESKGLKLSLDGFSIKIKPVQ